MLNKPEHTTQKLVANFTLQVWEILFSHSKSSTTAPRPQLNPTEALNQVMEAIRNVLNGTDKIKQDPSVPQFTPAHQRDDESDSDRSPP